MNYLIYIERSAENLQFYLWYQDYCKRFKEATTSDIKLAPEWTKAMEEDVVARLQKEKAEKLRKERPGAEIFKGSDFEKKNDNLTLDPLNGTNPFSTPPGTPGGSNADHESVCASSHAVSVATSYRSQAGEAFAAAGVKQPCTCLQFCLISILLHLVLIAV
jgi:hypothetical protein